MGTPRSKAGTNAGSRSADPPTNPLLYVVLALVIAVAVSVILVNQEIVSSRLAGAVWIAALVLFAVVVGVLSLVPLLGRFRERSARNAAQDAVAKLRAALGLQGPGKPTELSWLIKQVTERMSVPASIAPEDPPPRTRAAAATTTVQPAGTLFTEVSALAPDQPPVETLDGARALLAAVALELIELRAAGGAKGAFRTLQDIARRIKGPDDGVITRPGQASQAVDRMLGELKDARKRAARFEEWRRKLLDQLEEVQKAHGETQTERTQWQRVALGTHARLAAILAEIPVSAATLLDGRFTVPEAIGGEPERFDDPRFAAVVEGVYGLCSALRSVALECDEKHRSASEELRVERQSHAERSGSLGEQLETALRDLETMRHRAQRWHVAAAALVANAVGIMRRLDTEAGRFHATLPAGTELPDPKPLLVFGSPPENADAYDPFNQGVIRRIEALAGAIEGSNSKLEEVRGLQAAIERKAEEARAASESDRETVVQLIAYLGRISAFVRFSHRLYFATLAATLNTISKGDVRLGKDETQRPIFDALFDRFVAEQGAMAPPAGFPDEVQGTVNGATDAFSALFAELLLFIQQIGLAMTNGRIDREPKARDGLRMLAKQVAEHATSKRVRTIVRELYGLQRDAAEVLP